ncbi:hypothetical protein F5884DRAFT_681490 [Xylogone sp. PMI_703]|nr:hypothetical protein F5884DRAFT_681490 [Xylogone sp. PMI_703]
MSNQGGLTANPLRTDFDFNWVYLVELLVCGILTLFFLFYFNRLFATLVSYGLRAWTWHRYRIYIDVQALQISLLGGRVFFKGLRYHGNNETILIHSGYVTWCYWYRNVKELNLDSSHNAELKGATKNPQSNSKSSKNVEKEETEETTNPRRLSHRLNVTLTGAEWFVYNRSAAYDAIVTGMLGSDAEKVLKNDSKARLSISARHTSSDVLEKEQSVNEDGNQDASSKDPELENEGYNSQFLSTSRTEDNTDDHQNSTDADQAFILRFLPLHIECSKAAVVLGNENTKSVLITKVEKAYGEIDAARSSHLDQYKQLINFRFEHPVIQIKPNDDYKEDQSTAASRAGRGIAELSDQDRARFPAKSFFHHQRRKAWSQLQRLIPYYKGSVTSVSSSTVEDQSRETTQVAGSGWQGLPRYIDEGEHDDKAKWSGIEYATVSTIVDSPEASMVFYWDVAGNVLSANDISDSESDRVIPNINGDKSPEWGINLSFKGGMINYGPWADRQRADLQKVFFPSLCKDAVPSKPLSPGQLRVATEFKLYIEFEDEITLRIPIREESKNWKWMKQADTAEGRQSDQKRSGRGRKRKADKLNSGPEIRPFGWLDIKVAANATVAYSMDMVPGWSGFSNRLELDFPRTEITTSVNHGLLWHSAHTHIDCDLSNPLKWNGLRSWKFDIQSDALELYLLREHIFLLTDLIDDWASGPPPDYLTFSPFQYSINTKLDDFKLYFNVNDSNIINNPSDFDDNTFLIIFGASLMADILIPMDNYRPHRNTISFTTDMYHGGIRLQVPPWNTQATFMRSTTVAQLRSLAIKGDYQYCASTSPSNTDILFLDIRGHSPSVTLYGFVIRYFLKIKDNYFGEDIHFKTLEEYQEVLRNKRDGQRENSVTQPHKKSNDLDVILSISAEEPNIILPSNLYSAKRHTRIETAGLTADLRFTNYFMELEVLFSTLAFSQNVDDEESNSSVGPTQLFVDGLTISGNRLFGLPPTEPTYVCNWDFEVGSISGEITADFLQGLMLGGKCFAFSFDDDENALPSISEIILNDVTFLRASVSSVKIWLHVDESAFMLATGNIALAFNDWAGSHYSKKLILQIPNIHLGCVDAESASRHRARNHSSVATHAFVKSGVSFTMIIRNSAFTDNRTLQQEHIRRHDQRTRRADFLLHPYLLQQISPDIVDEPAMHAPPLPLPLRRDYTPSSDETSQIDSSSQRSARSLKHKSSFLSSNSSRKSSRSIIRQRSNMSRREQTDSTSRSGKSYKSSALDRPIPFNLSTSTSHRSSFHSTVGEFKTSQPSIVTFSSSYIAPHFPLEDIELETIDLPPLPQDTGRDSNSKINYLSLEDIRPDPVNEQMLHSSLIIELPVGIAAFFCPRAVNAVADLLKAIQPVDPVDMLDDLQMGAMDDVFSKNKQKMTRGKVVDMSILSPGISFRFLNPSTTDDLSSPDHIMIDQYDLTLSGLGVSTRSEAISSEPREEYEAKQSSTIHIKLSSMSLSAKERLDNTSDPHAAIRCLVKDVVFWIATSKETLADITFKSIETTAISRKIEYLASLLHRTNMLVSSVDNLFSSLTAEEHRRLQLFTYILATAGQQAADPLFLTRPSYVLRSASDHLRTSDSWKVISRLHHMYDSLDPAIQQDITMRCLRNTEPLPEDAQKRVIHGFDQWRSWDLNNLEACLVMEKIYGARPRNPVDLERPKSMRVYLRTKLLRVTLDPGPKQNEISLSDANLSLVIESKLPNPDTGPRGRSGGFQSTVLEIFFLDVSVKLNWELYELTQDLLNLYSQQPLETERAIPRANNESGITFSKSTLQVVVGTDHGSIIFDTINVRAVSTGQGLKTSFVMEEDTNNPRGQTTSLIIAADSATSKMRSRSQELTVFQLRYPSIYGSIEYHSINSAPQRVAKLAANCQQLSFNVLQDIQALIEIFDVIIGDELAQIERLRNSMPTRNSNQPQSGGKQESVHAINRIDIAMFLDMYHITIPLLHSLAYTISGVVARASIEAHPESDITFDFDVKENTHNFLSIVGSKAQSISLLQFPSTNGRITAHTTADETVISLFTSIEPIEFDATAIHSLLTTVNRPEILSVIADAKDDIQTIQLHLNNIYGPASTSNSKDNKRLVYDAHLTLAGLSVSANSDTIQEMHKTARLTFNLGTVQVLVANRLEQAGPTFTLPEIRVGLRHITIDLSRFGEGKMESCGNVTFMAFLHATSKNGSGDDIRSFHLRSDGLEINLFAETAPTIIDVIGHLQNKIKDLDLSRERQYLRKLRRPKPQYKVDQKDNHSSCSTSADMFTNMYSLEFLRIQVSWLIGSREKHQPNDSEAEDLVFSIKRVDLSKRKENAARLTIEDLQLQMVPSLAEKSERSLNSALLPEIIFNVGYVSTPETSRLAFQAAGKSLDIRLTSQFMIPAMKLQRSISSAVEKMRLAAVTWSTDASPESPNKRRQPFFGSQRIESLLIDADFAGAIVHLSGKMMNEPSPDTAKVNSSKITQLAKYGRFIDTETNSTTVLRAPGLAWKVEYRDHELEEPSLNAEIKVDASSNILYPSVVPLILEISSSIKEVVSEGDEAEKPPIKKSPQKYITSEEDNILTADPSAVLGRTKLNLGIRICRQEFSLSCQPIARVAATARFDNIYMTVNTVRSVEHGHFFAISAVCTRLQASVQHVYSRESTGSFEVDSIFLSLLNSKHVSGTSGISTILNICPVKVLINAKQLQDFLLFREIWMPSNAQEAVGTSRPPPLKSQSSSILVQRYQEVAATSAFPWNATVSIAAIDLQLDLGPSIGKPSFMISKFWISSKKTSDWEQNLCLGFDKIGVDCTGRMSGFVSLQGFKIRTSIQWPARGQSSSQTPLVQASLGFSQLRAKISFDYQAFLVADVTSFDFLMYNVHNGLTAKSDRLVAVLDGEAVQVFCTTTSAAQGFALYQAFLRLAQEKKSNYESSLSEIEKFMRRKSSVHSPSARPKDPAISATEGKTSGPPISLQTDVIVTLKALNLGVFPNTFSDHQVFKLEALNAQARFAVAMDTNKIHSILGLTLGQLRIGLAGVKSADLPKSVGDISVEDVVNSATGSRGGTILKVPRLQATMETWQIPESNHIDYIFKSSFEGKVEVGWNYSRISYIRSMWAAHSKALAQILGKPLPPSAVKITGVPDEKEKDGHSGEQRKITAEVNVPQSRYNYTALEPPIIETPQLRDMGEATPPLEWIGLSPQKLPDLTHQIIIVTLLELVTEVEDAYAKILGTS